METAPSDHQKHTSSLSTHYNKPHHIIIIIITIITRMIMTILMTETYTGTTKDCSQSPHCAANCLHHVRSSGPGTSVCKLHANTLGAYYMQNVMCHMTQRDSSAFKFDRVESHLFSLNFSWITFILFRWLKPLTEEGGEVTSTCGRCLLGKQVH